MAFQIPRPPMTEPNFKPDRAPKTKKKSAASKREGMSERHLELIRQLPCCIGCDHPGGDPHHLKNGTGERGMGLRSTDKWAVPMCRAHHDEIERAGSKNEQEWFKARGFKPLALAARLWIVTGSLDQMRAVLLARKETL